MLPSLISSILGNITNSPSSVLTDQTVVTPGGGIPPTELSGQTVAVPISPSQKVQDDFQSYCSSLATEITISDLILSEDDYDMSPDDIIRLTKYKDTMKQLIQSHQSKIQAISDHLIELDSELVSNLTESLHNLKEINKRINNLCK